MSENNEMNIKLYNIFKRQIISFYCINNEFVSESLVFALSKNMYPFFDVCEEIKLYSNCFTINEEQTNSVIKYLDDKWRHNDCPTFYQLEDEFQQQGIDRYTLITICHYCFIANRFDDNLWKKLDEDGPIEASSITRPFDNLYDIDILG